MDKMDKDNAEQAASVAALAASQEAEAQTQARAQEVAETTCPFMVFLTESVNRDASNEEMDAGASEVMRMFDEENGPEEKRARVGRKGEESKGKGSGGSSSSVNDAIKGKGNMGKGKGHE